MTTIRPAADALARTTMALGRILDLDPSVLRADTPLSEIGCDPVCVLAFCDVVAGSGPAPDARSAAVGAILASARTVGELASALETADQHVAPHVLSPAALGEAPPPPRAGRAIGPARHG